MAMTKKEKQIVANLLYRICSMGGIHGNPYGKNEVTEALTMMNGNIGKEFPAGRKSDRWAEETWKKYVSDELKKEQNEKFR